MNTTNWQVEGSCGEMIHGTTDEPDGLLSDVVLIGHGFKGYKDYGMFPWLAKQMASLGHIVHRFNFSHSGMLADDGPFERPDLFEKDTWNKQVNDLSILVEKFSIDGKPMFVLGHSRGGAACLLAAGRGRIDVDGVISLSAPSTCNPMPVEVQQELMSNGFIDSESFRTKQMLRVGKCFLQEQLDEPEAHDVLALVANIDAPVLLIHGEDDPTVSVDSAEAILSQLQNGKLVRIEGGDHVFNTSNPFPLDGQPSQQLAEVWTTIRGFLTQ